MTLSKATPEVKAAIVEALSQGVIIAHAVDSVGIGERTFYDWKDADPQFAADVMRARATSANRRIRRIEAAGEAGDWKADAWLLERQFREYRQAQEVEHSGSIGLEGVLLGNLAEAAE